MSLRWARWFWVATILATAGSGFLFAIAERQTDPLIQWCCSMGGIILMAGVVGWHCYQLGRIDETRRTLRREHVEFQRTDYQMAIQEIAIDLAKARVRGAVEDVWTHEDRLTQAVLGLTALPPRDARF